MVPVRVYLQSDDIVLGFEKGEGGGGGGGVVGGVVCWWRFIVISQQLSGAVMVRRWSAYIHPRLVRGQVCGCCSRQRRLRGLPRRSDESLQEII